MLSKDSYEFINKALVNDMDLIPLEGKRPIQKGWSTQPRLTTSQIKETFGPREYNIGIKTGPSSQLIVVDLDNNTQKQWAISNLPDTPMKTITGRRTADCPDGGVHLFYRYPTDCEVKSCDPTITTADGQKIKFEIKSDGKQVVGPYSIHPDSGVAYEMVGEWETLDDLPVFKPAWFGLGKTLVDIGEEPPSVETPTKTKHTKVDISSTSTGAWYRKNGHTVPENKRNNTLFTAACDYRATGVDIAVALHELLPVAVNSGLTDHEAAETINSAYSQSRTPTKKKDNVEAWCKQLSGPKDEGKQPSQKQLEFDWEMIPSQDIGDRGGPTKEGYWGNIIQSGKLTLFFGPEKGGKSTFLHRLYYYFSTGGEFLFPVQKCKVCVCTEEDDDLWGQYHDINEWDNDSIHIITVEKFLRLLPGQKQEHFEMAIDDLGQMCVNRGIQIIVFDTFRKLFSLDSYDDAVQIKKVFDPLKSLLCKKYKLAVVVVHHKKKNNKGSNNPMSAATGSNMLTCDADIVVQFDRDSKKPANVRKITLTGRIVGGGGDYYFEFDEHEHVYRVLDGCNMEDSATTNHKIWVTVPKEWADPKTIIKDCMALGVKKSTVYGALRVGYQDGYLERRKSGQNNSKLYRRTDKAIETLLDQINKQENDAENW